MLPRDTTSISYLAREDFRTSRRVFGIQQPDRLFHMYATGKTGTRKSTLLETLEAVPKRYRHDMVGLGSQGKS